MEIFFFFKQKTAYEILALTGVQTCALPIWRLLRRLGRRLRLRGLGRVGAGLRRRDRHRRLRRVGLKIGRASCRERVQISVVAVSLKKKIIVTTSSDISFLHLFSCSSPTHLS